MKSGINVKLLSSLANWFSGAWLLDNAKFLALFLLLIFITHGQSLQYYFVQDDAYSYFAAENWFNYYLGITHDLQYRPNAYAITRIIDLLFPDKAWPLRLFGMCMLLAITVLLYAIVLKVSGNKVLAVFSAILNAVHPGYYSMMTLYLSAAMTGLGLLFVLLTGFTIYLFAKSGDRRFYYLSMPFFLLALLSYEAAIISAPLICLVFFFTHKNAFDNSSSTCVQIKYTIFNLAPHIVLTVGYLALRAYAIDHHSATDSIGNYAISVTSILSNTEYLVGSLYGKYILLTFRSIPYEFILSVLGFFLVGALAFYNAKKNKILLMCWLALASILLGFVPFVLVETNGHTLHYVMYALPGFSVLLAMGLLSTWKYKYGAFLSFILLISVALFLSYLNFKAYENNVLVDQAGISQNINSLFYSLPREVREHKKIVFMNASSRIAAAIHYGETLDIASRENRRNYDFPQMGYAWHVKENFYSEQMAPHINLAMLFLEHFRVNNNYSDSKLHDVTHYVRQDAQPILFQPRVMTNKNGEGVKVEAIDSKSLRYVATEDLDYISLYVSPELVLPEKAHSPLSVTYRVENSSISSRLIVDNYFYTPIAKSMAHCRVKLSSVSNDPVLTFGFAAPPRQWQRNEYIALTLFRVKRGESFTLLSSSYKESFELPRTASIQRCSHSIFDYR